VKANVNADIISAAQSYNFPAVRKNDLNIPPTPQPTAAAAATTLAENTNIILRAEVELRDKNSPQRKQGKNKAKQFTSANVASNVFPASATVDVSMEKVGRNCYLIAWKLFS